MSLPDPFADLPVVGKLNQDDAAARLAEVGEADGGSQDPALPVPFGSLDFLPWRRKLWAGTTHLFGYLPPARSGSDLVPVVHPGTIAADTTLAGTRVRVTLERLRVAQYPGGGPHTVLIDFAARNSAAGEPADLHFSATYRVGEGSTAGVAGYPIFDGLPVGRSGLELRCYTVNVKSAPDEALLGFLDGDAFRTGLRLVGATQPALAPLSAMVMGLTRAMAGRSRNVPVQDFTLGLDFGGPATGLRLAEGTYLAVQVTDEDAAKWDWGRWAYDPGSGQIVGAGAEKQSLPYNYIGFGISRILPDSHPG